MATSLEYISSERILNACKNLQVDQKARQVQADWYMWTRKEAKPKMSLGPKVVAKQDRDIINNIIMDNHPGLGTLVRPPSPDHAHEDLSGDEFQRFNQQVKDMATQGSAHTSHPRGIRRVYTQEQKSKQSSGSKRNRTFKYLTYWFHQGDSAIIVLWGKRKGGKWFRDLMRFEPGQGGLCRKEYHTETFEELKVDSPIPNVSEFQVINKSRVLSKCSWEGAAKLKPTLIEERSAPNEESELQSEYDETYSDETHSDIRSFEQTDFAKKCKFALELSKFIEEKKIRGRPQVHSDLTSVDS